MKKMLVGLILATVGFVILPYVGGCSTASPAPMIGQGDLAEHSECGVLMVCDVDEKGNLRVTKSGVVDAFSLSGVPMKATNWIMPGEDPRNPDGHYKYGRYPD
jgi:hypothetical protein